MSFGVASTRLHDQQSRTTFWKTYSPILLLGLVFRLIATLFSQGYGMHDDHFLVIEAAGSWVEGFDYNHWLPSSPGNNGPEGHSFTYVGLHYFFFLLLKVIGIVDPKIMMLLVRLVHALFSMLTVVYGIKITEKLSDRASAKIVGYLLAGLWIFPILSVRQLFEFTPVPFILLALWLAINNKQKIIYTLYAGLLLGLAASFRYQIGLFAIGMAAVYFFQWKWKPFMLLCLGTLLAFCLTQGLVDFFVWGYPFAEMTEYIRYNLNEGTQYLPNTNYFMYFYVLIGSLLVPLGILIFIGFFAVKREHLLLFVSTLLFLLFHTWYPNRQERFILTILPVFILLGVIGFQRIVKGGFQNKWWKASWIIFWIVNIPLLIATSMMSTKKSRVDSMYSLYNISPSPQNILLEGSGVGKTSLMPRFYSKNWASMIDVQTTIPDNSTRISEPKYDYILFFEQKNLAQRIEYYKTSYPDMTLHKKCDPSGLDVLLKTFNPRNANEYIEVWACNAIQK